MRRESALNFKEELEKRIEEAEEIVADALPSDDTIAQGTIVKAMRYAVLSGGKRLRPVLMRETFRIYGGEGDLIRPFMAAQEMIHSYSLVHDDLPAMDDDDLRRGKPATHKAFGEAMGILAGDALLNGAFETASEAFVLAPEKAADIGKALRIMSRKSGLYGMIGGQVIDIESVGIKVSAKTLERINLLKTGALLESAMMVGAALAGAPDEEIRRMEKAGRCLGIAFQIEDDILDTISTTEELGKNIGSDDRNHKTTYVSLLGLEGAKEKVKEYSDEAIRLVSALPDSAFLTALMEALMTRRK